CDESQMTYRPPFRLTWTGDRAGIVSPAEIVGRLAEKSQLPGQGLPGSGRPRPGSGSAEPGRLRHRFIPTADSHPTAFTSAADPESIAGPEWYKNLTSYQDVPRVCVPGKTKLRRAWPA